MSKHVPVRAVLFDAYGTLFRLDSIEDACAVALVDAGSNVPTSAFLGLWRAKQLEYSVHRSLMGEAFYRDFAEITAEALDYTSARFEVEFSSATRDALLRSWATPGVDPDTAALLRALDPLPCAILSNGTPQMLQAAVASGGIADGLQALLSASDARVYKPHPRVYALGVERFGAPAAEIGFVTANGWDATGAATFGFQVCWVNRQGVPTERHGPAPAVTVDSLGAVANVFALH